MPLKNSKRAVQRISLALLAATLIGLSLLFITHAAKDEHTSHSPVAGPAQDERLKSILSSRVISDFDGWVKRVEAVDSLNDTDIEKGRALAVNRRELFKELMTLSPKAALERAVPSEVYRRLPASITTQLETPVSAYGDFRVYVVMLHDHHSPEMMTGSRIEREVTIGTSRYRALVYGRRENITTKLNIPLQGITLDGVMVVDEDPVRRIHPTEFQALNVDRTKVVNTEAVAEVGGKLVYFSSQPELEKFVSDQIAWEARIGPVLDQSNWTEGAKTVLFIRLDFPDKPGEPVDFQNQPLTVTRAQNLINNEVSPFYVNNSFNKTSLQTTVTPVIRMPQTQSFYFTDFSTLRTDAETAARGAGFDPDNFNLDLFAMSYNEGFGYGGIAFVGARGAALNGSFNLRVAAHELGHNYGLFHANLWLTTDGSTIGPGNNVEYGNPYDVMGGGFDSRSHFSAPYKRRLDWLTDANVQEITQDGVYRVVAHDSTTPGGIRALKIRKNIDKNYWIEFRQLFTEIPFANGAIINWDYRSHAFSEVEILDMAPATSSVFDAPLQIGSVFNDDENRIRITVIGKGNTTPESLDVKVELNVGCTFSITQTSQSFTASGGEGSIPLTTLTGCRPLATSNSNWLQPLQTDTSPLRYVVAANYDSSPRTGTITIAGQTFTVQQAGATTACAPQPPGLVAWWQGEGNVLDQTGNNNGTLVNSMSFGGGKVGGGFLGASTNPVSYAEVPDSPSLTLTQSLTIEGWVRLDVAGGNVLQRSTNTFPLLRSYEIRMFGDSLGFIIWYNGNSGIGFSTNPLPLGQFTHFAVTLDDSTNRLSMYINGALVRQFTAVTQRPNAAPGATTKIGSINGITDELSVYNRVLSASEILTIYNAGNAGTGAAGKCLVSSPSIPITIQSNPVGRSFSIDGAPAVTTTQVVNWTPGSSHTIATTSPQAGSTGSQFAWSNWSDGGAMSHTVTAPAASTTYTANFATQFQLTTSAGTGGSVQPASGFFNSGQVVQISALANPNFAFAGWTGAGAGSFTGNTNPVSVTINGPISEAAAFNFVQLPIQLLLEQTGPTINQAVALDSVLYLRDPFPVVNTANLLNLGNDRNTRLLIFATNVNLAPGESAGAVVVNLVDSNNQSYDIAAENVWSGAGSDFGQVTFRLPDALPPGTCTITVKLHGQVSNIGSIRIKP